MATMYKRVRRLCGLFVVGAVVIATAQSGLSDDKQASSIGRKVNDFTLRDAGGKSHSLSDFVGKQAVVIAVLGTECPLATLYAPRLVQLAERFEKRGVAFIG